MRRESDMADASDFPSSRATAVINDRSSPACRHCGAELTRVFADLGMSPLANRYVSADELSDPEVFYPLIAYVCDGCLLVQLPPTVDPETLFSDYAYFSSYSDTWLEHSRRYAEKVIVRFGLDASSLVMEVASNDGYLLQYFAGAGVPVLGIEPAANVAEAAEAKGVPTLVRFFGEQTAHDLVREGKRANLLAANNVLAHVPDLNGFVKGIEIVLAPGGVATLEFPQLLQLIERNAFDTIYHEHFSYFSFMAVQSVFAAHGLTIFDVDELSTHGGSMRIYARRTGDEGEPVSERVEALLEKERGARLDDPETYTVFAEQVIETKRNLLRLLIELKSDGRSLVGYGAAAKGNTLLNYCGIGPDFLDYTADRSPHKQGHYLPGTHLPIHAPEHISETKPDFVLILPWNLQEEIIGQLAHVREWGGRFVVPIPRATVID
jgi:SAM-dependent methyltransferase